MWDGIEKTALDWREEKHEVVIIAVIPSTSVNYGHDKEEKVRVIKDLELIVFDDLIWGGE